MASTSPQSVYSPPRLVCLLTDAPQAAVLAHGAQIPAHASIRQGLRHRRTGGSSPRRHVPRRSPHRHARLQVFLRHHQDLEGCHEGQILAHSAHDSS